MEKGDWNTEFKKAPNGSRVMGSHQHWSEHTEMPLESTYGTKQSLPSGQLIDSDMLEGSSHFVESVTNARARGKRKSRWDQSNNTLSPHDIKVQKTGPIRTWRREEEIDEDIHTLSDEIEDEQYPGPFKCPSQMPLGYSQERFNSGLPVAYGIPLGYVQEFGTPQASAADCWVIAPGMPFRPFPPLPLCLREGRNHTDQGYPGLSPNTIPTVNAHLQHDNGPCSSERRPFKQRQNDFRRPPWGFNRNGYGDGRNFPSRPSGLVNDRNEHPEYVNYGVDLVGNSC